MRPGAPPDDPRREPRVGADEVAQAEDFLYHLHRGSEMLLKNRVLEAKEELERALAHQPQDAKSQDLLAGVYFRLGVYPRAIEIWSSLVAAYPSDVTLRVNLALAYVKTGMSDDAREHALAALRIQPDHERAWGYLGLIHWRSGRIVEARDAFLRAGQAPMARRMEEILAEDAPRPVDAPAKAEEQRAQADSIAQAIDDRPTPRSIAPHAGPLSRASRLPPPPAVPSMAPPPPSTRTVAELSTLLRPSVPEDAACALESSGRLVVRSPHGFCLRTDLAQTVVATAPGLPVHRRVGGIDVSAVMGGERPIHRFSGQVEAIVRAPTNSSIELLRIDDSALFVVESRLAGFASGLELECNKVAVAGEEVALVRLSGQGEVALIVDAGLRILPISRGRDARVRPSTLVGFSGAVFASAATGVSALSLVLRGEGHVLVA